MTQSAAARALLLAVALLASNTAAGTERILSFDSRIEVAADTSLEVTETIRVKAEGNQIRRGIFREFPTIYSRADGSHKTVGFDVLGVQRNGVKEPYHLERRVNGIAVYIGDKDRLLSAGEHRYEIRYRTDRQLGLFPDHDELYWNVTGNGWAFPIDIATARVILPAGIPADAMKLEGYTGSQGAHGKNYEAGILDAIPSFETTRPLAAQQGLTIVVSWPKGFVTAPGDTRSVLYLVRDNAPLAWSMATLLFVLGYYIVAWKLVGRDPARGVVIPQYRPPDGESPASMRYLERMGYDNRCFVAAVLSLAVKGYLVIEQEAGGVLRRGKYALKRTGGSTTPLAADESVLLSQLGDGVVLDDKNYAILQGARRAHEAALRKGSQTGYFQLNRGWTALGVLMSPLALALGIVLPATAGGFGIEWLMITPAGWATAAIALAVLAVNIPFAKLMRAPTVAGRRRMDQIEGFRLYLNVAEGDELKLAGAPRKTPGLFETYLPFALALGVSQRWSEQFADVFRTQAVGTAGYSPQWYQGDDWDIDNVSGFSSSLSGSFESSIASASTPPGDSSGGGSSDGGSSGGGGGGGGGGGW